MADFQQNITNAVNVFGNGPSTKWGETSAPTMIWGTSNWGEGEPLAFQVVHYFTETQSLAWDRSEFNFSKQFSFGEITANAAMSLETLRNGVWDVVFVSDTTNATERDFASWTEVSKPDVTFTCGAAASTTWDEV